MSTIHHLPRDKKPDLVLEDFGTAVYCSHVVFPWKEISIAIFTDRRCWGYDIPVPEGSYVRTGSASDRTFVRQEQTCTYTIDDDTARIEIIRIVNDAPLRLECLRYVGTDAAEDDEDRRCFDDDFICHLEDGRMVIEGYTGDPFRILIPATLSGHTVSKVLLGDDVLPEACETLLVSEGITEIELNDMDRCYMVYDDIPLHEIPKRFRRCVGSRLLPGKACPVKAGFCLFHKGFDTQSSGRYS